MALVGPVTLNIANLKTAYRFLVDPSPHLDHGLPFIRALGLVAFRVQDEVIGVPIRWGFFSPGPSRLQAMEACLFANLLATSFLVVSIAALCVCRGESCRFLLCCLTVIPVACVSTYIEARRVSFDGCLAFSAMGWLTSRSIASGCRRPGRGSVSPSERRPSKLSSAAKLRRLGVWRVSTRAGVYTLQRWIWMAFDRVGVGPAPIKGRLA